MLNEQKHSPDTLNFCSMKSRQQKDEILIIIATATLALLFLIILSSFMPNFHPTSCRKGQSSAESVMNGLVLENWQKIIKNFTLEQQLLIEREWRDVLTVSMEISFWKLIKFFPWDGEGRKQENWKMKICYGCKWTFWALQFVAKSCKSLDTFLRFCSRTFHSASCLLFSPEFVVCC